MKLSEKDLKIIEFLKKDARKPLKEIAKELDISIPAVSLRIRDLIKRGIIKGYHADVDYNKLGEVCQLILKIRLDQSQNTKDIGQKLSEFENICLVVNITGDYDFLVLARCKNDEDGTLFINKIRRLDGIARVTSQYILECFKQKI